MPTSGSPTVRRRRLAAELRRLRLASGMTSLEVGQLLNWSKAKVSRYELAQGGLNPAEVKSLLDVYGVRGSHRKQLLALAVEATQKGWWEAYSDVLTDATMEFIGLEAEATSIQEWQMNVVPGLLQTERYALEILSGHHEVATVPPAVIDRRLEVRLRRQQLLLSRKPLLQLAVVLDESVLLRRRGDHSVMREQLQRLAEASDLPNVTLQVRPLSKPQRLAADSFAILHFGEVRETSLHDVVNTEFLSNQLYVEGETNTYEVRLAFEHIAAESLTSRESRNLILHITQRDWS